SSGPTSPGCSKAKAATRHAPPRSWASTRRPCTASWAGTRSVSSNARSLRLSVLIPVYNEAGTVAHVVERVRAVPLQSELMAIDDASTDGSGELLEDPQRPRPLGPVVRLPPHMCTHLDLPDMETCYKLVRADLMKRLPLRSNRFGFEVEITARLAQAGARIWELPISYSGRTYAEGKKITWRDGVAALLHIARYNLFPPRGEWRRR